MQIRVTDLSTGEVFIYAYTESNVKDLSFLSTDRYKIELIRENTP